MIITVRIIMIMIVAREILRIIMMIIIKFINHDNNNNNCHYDDGSDINKRERKEIIVYMTDLYNLWERELWKLVIVIFLSIIIAIWIHTTTLSCYIRIASVLFYPTPFYSM